LEELSEPRSFERVKGVLLLCSSVLFIFAFGLNLKLLSAGEITPGCFVQYLIMSSLTGLLWYRRREPESVGHSLLGGLSLLLFFPMGLILSTGWLFWQTLQPPPLEGPGELGEEDMKVFKLASRPWNSWIFEQEELFVPAVSLLERGDVEERRAAIEVLAQIGGPEQIRHLQTCLDDPEREVYQYAHAKLSELHERHTEAIRAAETKGRKQQLLDSYMGYIQSGLLGEATQDFYRQKAVRTAVNLLKEQPESVPLLNLLGQLYIEQGAEQEARLLLDKALSLEPASLEARFGLAQLAYSSQDYDALRAHLKPLSKVAQSEKNVRAEVRDAVTWWLDGHDD
jgi:tetratricopeptide (TPR) repeat protein